MATGRAYRRLGQLWQMPALILSFALFGYAAYLFIDPKPGPTMAERIEAAEVLSRRGHHEAAISAGNELLKAKLKPEEEARLHLMLSQALDDAQQKLHLEIKANRVRVIEQARAGMALGAAPTADIQQRIARNFDALGEHRQAIAAYQSALKLDPSRSALLRRTIELQLEQEDPAEANASIDRYLKLKDLSVRDRAWAMLQRAQAMVNAGEYDKAKDLLAAATKLDADKLLQGAIHYWLGYCTWKLGDNKESERLLRVAANELKSDHPLAADADYLLGRLCEERKAFPEAISFYEDVVANHPASGKSPLARLRRGVARIEVGSDDAGLTDIHEVVGDLVRTQKMPEYSKEVLEGLRDATTALADRKNYQGAIEVMETEQGIQPDVQAEFFARLASVYERRADQLDKAAEEQKKPDAIAKLQKQASAVRIQAGDAQMALGDALTLTDDRGQGDAIWKAIDLYDRAGATQKSISALEVFAAQRPSDPATPDALLRLGRAYQATGQYELAVKKLEWIQLRFPQSLAATKSGVPLAQAYIARGPEFYPRAERVLRSVLENNPIISPDAEEFRQALFELSQLYYRTSRYEEAVARLEETTQRYPTDPKLGQLLFLMGDSYRKSAELLSAKIDAPATRPSVSSSEAAAAAAAAAAAHGEAVTARHDRLIKAKKLFDRVVDQARIVPPTRDLDRLYLKLSQFYRADCMYDLREYEEAIRLYDAATLRYQDDPSAVAAYMQIVNAYCALGRLDDARTATQRARWLLKRMPDSAFQEGRASMPRKYWEDWLRLTAQSGIYAKDLGASEVSAAQ